MGKVKIQFAISDDLRTAESALTASLIQTNNLQKTLETQKKDLSVKKSNAVKFYNQYKAAASELGLDPSKNMSYVMVEKLLDNELIKDA